jgi:hypothetical protein
MSINSMMHFLSRKVLLIKNIWNVLPQLRLQRMNRKYIYINPRLQQTSHITCKECTHKPRKSVVKDRESQF